MADPVWDQVAEPTVPPDAEGRAARRTLMMEWQGQPVQVYFGVGWLTGILTSDLRGVKYEVKQEVGGAVLALIKFDLRNVRFVYGDTTPLADGSARRMIHLYTPPHAWGHA